MQHSDDMVIINLPDKLLPQHIAEFLSGSEWDASTIEAIADLLTWNGYVITDTQEEG